MNLENFFGAPPPARTPTVWEEVFTKIHPEIWWGTKAMDYLLCQRDTAPALYYPHARRNLLTLVRAFVTMEDGSPKAHAELHDRDKKFIRKDVAELFGDIQMFDVQDRVDFGQLKYGQHLWRERTRLGRDKFHEHRWDILDFDKFMKEGRQKQSW